MTILRKVIVMLRVKNSYQKIKTALLAKNITKCRDTQIENPKYEYPSLLQELEPRMMFDGAAVETVDLADGVSEQEQIYVLDAMKQNENAHATNSLLEAIAANAEGFQTDYSQFKEVVIIDANVKDPHVLIKSISREAAIEIILPEQDGVEAIAKILEKYQSLDAVHIISHGDQAKLELGSVSLTHNNLTDYHNELQQWGQALTKQGDILFYGCDVAEGDKGQAFVDELKALTSADIAASTDTTGADVLGGDSILEMAENVDVDEVVSFDRYQSILAAPEIVSTAGGDGYQQIDSITGSGFSPSVGGISTSLDGQVMAVSKVYASVKTVEIYQRNGNNWELMGSPISGSSGNVSLSADGQTIAISTDSVSKVYYWNGAQWLQKGNNLDALRAPIGYKQIALAEDGEMLILTNSSYQTKVYKYNQANSLWEQMGANLANGTEGHVDIALLNGAGDHEAVRVMRSAGAAVITYIWNPSTEQWNSDSYIQGTLTAGINSHQVRSIDLSDDGTTLVFGKADANYYNGSVQTYQYNGTSWEVSAPPIIAVNNEIFSNNSTQGSAYGYGVRLSADAKTLVVAANWARSDDGNARQRAGGVQILKYIDGAWQEQSKLFEETAATNAAYGSGIALTADASLLFVAQPGVGSNAYTTDEIFVYESVALSSQFIYTEDDGEVVIDDQIQLSDVDSSVLQSAKIQITQNYQNGEDVLDFTTIGNITGSFDTTQGILLLSGEDTVENYQAALRTVIYQNTSQNPAELQRYIQFTVNDGVDESNFIRAIIDVVSVNDAPEITLPNTAITNEDSPLVFSSANSNAIVVNDLEGGFDNIVLNVSHGTLTVMLSGSATISAGNNNSQTLTLSGTQADVNATLDGLVYTPDENYFGSDTLKITSKDTENLTNIQTLDISINSVNDIPSLTSVPELLTVEGVVAGDYFGSALDISSDGNTMVIAAPGDNGNIGALYVRTYGYNGWEVAKISNPDGTQVDFANNNNVRISGDGHTIVVGAQSDDVEDNNAGAIYVFTFDGTTWSAGEKIVAPSPAADAQFGKKVYISDDGQRLLVVDKINDGTAHVYHYENNAWTYKANFQVAITPDGDSEAAVYQLSGDGKHIVAANKDENLVKVYSYDEVNGWSGADEVTLTVPTDANIFGLSVDITDNGNRLVVGGIDNTSTNVVYIFDFESNNWNVNTKLSSDEIGVDYDFAYNAGIHELDTLRLSGDGTVLLVGEQAAGNSGAVYIFKETAGNWSQLEKIVDDVNFTGALLGG